MIGTKTYLYIHGSKRCQIQDVLYVVVIYTNFIPVPLPVVVKPLGVRSLNFHKKRMKL